MEKEWNKGAVAIYFEDAANEKFIKRNYSDTIQGVTPEQVEGFTSAVEALTIMPASYTVVVEEYRYNR
ncbi:MAG: hypothetical protein RR548_03935 [Carnobacterium sp.]|uniref:Uncharacterized protein n=1 Tax=Carnobacterium antarcticum TaxID=2126436 RepID=A0ABW4NL94_9LACT|nr:MULTISPECIES: hypothetical protein [unclassified Carnobacterium]ALV21490.1 hypothetical protein NY10_875 [Carnobacterium sp. CP1]QQP69488.1 hypothetical protein JHE06_07625 [Carnobacterium sp. CS13]